MLDYSVLQQEYKAWRDTPLYGCLEVYDRRYEYTSHPDKFRYLWFKLAKRGNDVYVWKVNNRLGEVKAGLGSLGYIKPSLVDKTNALFFSLTYAQSGFGAFDLWDRVGSDYNRFKSLLTKRYGRVSVFRAWESHKSGFPHIHLVAVFHDFDFTTFRDSKGKLRIHLKDEVAEVWPHGWVDIQGVSNLLDSFLYVEKELTKSLKGHKGLLTLAICWKLKKRSYSLSRDFINARVRLDLKECNSNSIDALGLYVQKTFDGSNLQVLSGSKFGLEYEFLGCFVINCTEKWRFVTSDPPDVVLNNLELINF